jgi:hypothetical protein
MIPCYSVLWRVLAVKNRSPNTKPWNLGILAKDQERLNHSSNHPTNCELTPLLGNLNGWNFITTALREGKNSNKARQQVNRLFQK